MYQMLAYAIRYEKEKNKDVEITLIYPKYSNFNNSIKFTISTPSKIVPINVIPFDLESDTIQFNC